MFRFLFKSWQYDSVLGKAGGGFCAGEFLRLNPNISLTILLMLKLSMNLKWIVLWKGRRERGVAVVRFWSQKVSLLSAISQRHGRKKEALSADKARENFLPGHGQPP
jgi:hypothetical protein